MSGGNHWYTETGEPCHTIMGVSGKMVQTTLTQARANSLFPSVTSILGILAKPGLLNWQYRQITDACFESSAIDFLEQGGGLTDIDKYSREMVDKAFAQVKDAADAGTMIHHALESELQGKGYDKEGMVYLQAIDERHPLKTFVEPVKLWLREEGIEIQKCELRLVNKEEGYAGVTDCAATKHGFVGILDFKSKKTKKGEKVKPYSEQIMQISAYDAAEYNGILSSHWGLNLFISTTEPGRVEGIYYTGAEMVKAYEAFKACCQVWRYSKKYDPRVIG